MFGFERQFRSSCAARKNAASSFPKPLVIASTVVALAAVLGGFAVMHRLHAADADASITALAEAAPAYRTFEGRLSAIPYRPFRPVVRGGDSSPDDTSTWRVIRVAANIQKQVDNHATSVNLHALGVAYLILGDARRAVPELEKALIAEQHAMSVADAVAATRDDSSLDDLSAAYLARSESAHIASDRLSALNCAERAWKLRPSAAAAWNRAIAATKLRLSNRIAAAWKDYLLLDTSSPWAHEARTRERQQVTNPRNWRQWRPVIMNGGAAAREMGDRKSVV